MVSESTFRHLDLAPDDAALLTKIAGDLPILADLCRADLMLYCASGPNHLVAITQATAHLSSPLVQEVVLGERLRVLPESEVMQALEGRSGNKAVYTATVRGATVARALYEVRNGQGHIIAVLAQDAYWLAHERHRRRNRAFQEALTGLVHMVLRGEMQGAHALTEFGEHDGVLYVGADFRVQYMSGIASELYRQLGYPDALIGHNLAELDTPDKEMATQAINERRCLEREHTQNDLTWVRKAIPLRVPVVGPFQRLRKPDVGLPGCNTTSRGAILLVHDATEALRTQRELEYRTALVRDMHHRVKNNLQMIASIMGMQARRAKSDEVRAALEESINRIMSVAVVHEFLSHNAQGSISLREVANRITLQMQQSLIAPGKQVKLVVTGADIWLPAERATQCALVVNELVQNAIEHGMRARDQGTVQVTIGDAGETVTVSVCDDGEGLPEGFDVETNANLGLRIVKSMVERDLKGRFVLEGGDAGTCATVRFNKANVGGGG
jgi:two-component sensor histidine kinase